MIRPTDHPTTFGTRVLERLLVRRFFRDPIGLSYGDLPVIEAAYRAVAWCDPGGLRCGDFVVLHPPVAAPPAGPTIP